ncbi:MAG: hypothetical protein JWP57_4089 [Spirosoma sp.]|nr:hypothetical protein [Spirosoma sp.]
MTLRATAVIALIVLLLGCTKPPEINVEEQWSDAMRRLNMFAFYPMSEDVRVGDVYLHVPPRDGSAPVARFSLLRIGSFHHEDVLDLLQDQQSRRPQIRPLPERRGTDGKPAGGGVDTSTVCEGREIGHADTNCPLRLQRSAIPALTVGRITAGQLGASGLFGNFGARLGLGASSQTAVSIKLDNMQELLLDGWRFDRLLRGEPARRHGQVREPITNVVWAEALIRDLAEFGQTRPELVRAACHGDFARLAAERVEVVVINRVVYAGRVEYSFTRSAEQAIRAAVDLQSILPHQPQAPQLPQLAGGTPTADALRAQGTDPAKQREEAGARLAALLSGITGDSGGAARAGVTTSFGLGTFGVLALTQDFNRPVAVGAGSRRSEGLHFWMAGPGTNESLRAERFWYAHDECARRPDGVNSPRLAAAMGFAAVPPRPPLSTRD